MAESVRQTIADGAAGTAAKAPARPRASITLVRGKLVDGDLAGARQMFEELDEIARISADGLLVEAAILEGETRYDEALERLTSLASSSAGSARVNAQARIALARLAVRQKRPSEAGTAAVAILAIDPANLDGLRALAFTKLVDDETEAWLEVQSRIAGAPAASEADLWGCLDAFAGAGRWDTVLSVLEARRFELDPWRWTLLRARGLIELGWRETALEHLIEAHDRGYVRVHLAVDSLASWGALGVAARFVEVALKGKPWEARARSILIIKAAGVCAAAPAQESPLAYADAVLARAILSPESEPVVSDVGRTLAMLKRTAAAVLADGQTGYAIQLLCAAVRLAPTDRGVMEALAETARVGGDEERYLHTLLWLWRRHRDGAALLAAARGAIEAGSWSTILRIIGAAGQEAVEIGVDLTDLLVGFQAQAVARLEQFLADGDVGAGLDLVIGLREQFPIESWPNELIARLLRTAKRGMRGQGMEGDSVSASLGAPYLMLSPGDADVCRMLARVRVRQRRLEEARDLFVAALDVNPHVASDWLALTNVLMQLGETDEGWVCHWRARVLAPDIGPASDQTAMPQPALAS